MASALGFAPDGSDAMLVFSMRAGSFNDESLMEFITELRELLEGDKATLIWDGLPSHRSRAMNQFLKTQRYWLVTERLPAYGHDLNPVEQVWGNLNSPISVPIRSKKRPCRPTTDSCASAATRNFAFPSSNTAVSPCDQSVSVLTKGL